MIEMTEQNIPPRKKNGGLYTGEAFSSKAWANVPITPDAGNMVHNGLRHGNTPPSQAIYQYVCQERQGNSTPSIQGLVKDEYTMMYFLPE
jgi:hypothetical protein